MSNHQTIQINQEIMRHSLAHVMAAAINNLWPAVKFGIGPVIENGFYYDIDINKTLTPEDLDKIEIEMKKLIAQNLKFEKLELKIDKAIEQCKKTDQIYKVELLKDLKIHGTTILKELEDNEFRTGFKNTKKITKVSFYRTGKFEDLCRGPHVKSTSELGVFKLTKISGAYWRGDQAKPQMQRIYGVGFATNAELDKYFKQMDESKKRDHRKLGQDLDLFFFSDLVGSGLPLWTPRGTILRNNLDRFVQDLRDEYGYQEVNIPHIAKKELYIKSGHWKKFNNELFKIKTRENHEFAMKPMNCPHHAQIYLSRPRSYKELPIRYRETTTCYRDEQTGELAGLSRLRAFTQDDAHVFCRVSQIEDEILIIWNIVDKFYSTLGLNLKLRFSTHDPANLAAYSGKEENWKIAENQLKKVIAKKGIKNYINGLGEAAFYGPKLDFISEDALGRELQVATIQLDFNQPETFDLSCVNEHNDSERIVMIHAAIMGSIDRFLAVLIEHFAGDFPLWLAPEQIRIATINDSAKIINYAEKLAQHLKLAGLRVRLDQSNESIAKKIRDSEITKIPYTLVVGEKEIKSSKLALRVRAQKNIYYTNIDQLTKTLQKEIANKSLKSLFI